MMLTVNAWSSTKDFEDFVANKGSGFIFKHSTRCPVSTHAHDEVTEFASKNPDIPVHMVLVVENRSTARAISDTLELPHASPQVILLREGKNVWDVSHDQVTAEALSTAWKS